MKIMPFWLWRFFRWCKHLFGFHNKFCIKSGLWEVCPHGVRTGKGLHCSITGIEF